MGKSDSIRDKMAQQEEFRKFMDALEVDSKKEEDRIFGEITALVARQYDTSGWDHARFFGDKRSDYQNYSDWSLSRINNIIDSIGNALKGGNFPSSKLPGSDEAAPSTINNAKEFLGAFGGDYDLIIARVQALVSGVLSQFAVASDVVRKASLQDMPLSGGLHLFFGSSGSVSKNNTFFTNQFIGSFQIVFEVYMSVDEAKAIGLQQILKTTATELGILNDMILDIRMVQAESLKKIIREKPQDYVSTKLAYDMALASVKEDRARLMEEYNNYSQVVETVDSLYDQLDLSEFNGKNALTDGGLTLSHLFNQKEERIARQYIGEKLKELV